MLFDHSYYGFLLGFIAQSQTLLAKDTTTPTNFIQVRPTLFLGVITVLVIYSTVTDLARLRGLSTSVPFFSAV